MPKYNSDMPWNELMIARFQERKNPGMQEVLAPMEHQAYARERVSENPLLAAVYPGLEAGYQTLKATGLMKLISPEDDMSTHASLDQLIGTWKGTQEGLRDFLTRLNEVTNKLYHPHQPEEVASPFYKNPFPDTTK